MATFLTVEGRSAQVIIPLQTILCATYEYSAETVH